MAWEEDWGLVVEDTLVLLLVEVMAWLERWVLEEARLVFMILLDIISMVGIIIEAVVVMEEEVLTVWGLRMVMVREVFLLS